MYLILAVDDDPEVMRILKSFLESKGYMVEQAFSGVDASVKAEQIRPCLIILDILMPVTYGSSVYESLQRDESTKNIPVIFMTGLDSDTAHKVMPSSGNVRYIHKPVDWKLMEQYIHELIGDSRG